MKFLKPWTFFFVAAAVCLGRTEPSRQPIIDVHLHSASDSALKGDWPEAIGIAVETIEKAAFLTAEQKQDILYNNAARFLRLTPGQIAKHHVASNK